MIEFLYKLKHKIIIRILFWIPINILRYTRKIVYRFTNNSKIIREFKNKYNGGRCFIIGNGPSLSISDLEKIKDEVTFCSNRIYSLFDRTSFRPKYYIVSDPEIIAENRNFLSNYTESFSLLSLVAKKYLKHNENNVFINIYSKFKLKKFITNNIIFSEQIEDYIGDGYTVSYIAMQLACYMGFKEIYLLGMDHSYSKKINSSNEIIENKNIKDHYYEDKNTHVGYQYTEGVNYAYQKAKDYCDANQIIIKNATRGGNLEIFDRIDFDSLIKTNERNKL